MNSPLITIITITFNSEKYVEQTIKSIIRQTYNKTEYIIIDGASTDSTLHIIKKYENFINYWISEPDNGIADAMNKGLKIAKGDYILFLHSDDYLADEKVLDYVSHYLDPDHDMFLFNIFFKKNGTLKLVRPRGFNWWMNFKTGVWHQGTICSYRLFRQVGNFDTIFKIAMDYDFFLRAYRNRIKVRKIDIPLSIMRDTGISSQLDWPTLQKRFEEERKIHSKNCKSNLMFYIYAIYWFLYLPYRKIYNIKNNLRFS